MKKLYILLWLTIISLEVRSQVVFCPAGAEWHYAFRWLRMPPYTGKIFNVEVKYVRDSVMGQGTFKVLQHQKFFKECGAAYYSGLTILKQVGDTVFFRNMNTNHTWQVLYNFNAPAGQSWTATIYESSTIVKTHTVTVQSVTTVTINGFALKQLAVSHKFDACNAVNTQTSTITERLGSSSFLFDFSVSDYCICDFDYFYSPLCYQDDVFSLYKYTTMDCDYFDEINVGIKENAAQGHAIVIYPSPSKQVLHVDLTPGGPELIMEGLQMHILNTLGQEVLVENWGSSPQQIEVNVLPPGIYFLELRDREKTVAVKKFMKE
jgi:hypothetical protein